jgi:hypothetical protein
VISDVVVREVNKAPKKEAEQINRIVDQARPIVYPISEEMESLARADFTAGILPEGRAADALHIAAQAGSTIREDDRKRSDAFVPSLQFRKNCSKVSGGMRL